MGGVADEERLPGAKRGGDVAAHHERHHDEDLGLQIRQAGAGSDELSAPLGRPVRDRLAGVGVPFTGVDPPIVGAGGHEQPLGARNLNGIEYRREVGQPAGEVGAKGHRDELADRAQIVDADAQSGTHGAARAVRTDQIPGLQPLEASSSAVAHLGVHAGVVSPAIG